MIKGKEEVDETKSDDRRKDGDEKGIAKKKVDEAINKITVEKATRHYFGRNKIYQITAKENSGLKVALIIPTTNK